MINFLIRMLGNIKFLIKIALIAFTFGCATKKYEALKWDGTSSARVVKLSKADIASDVELLIYALREAYIGSDFIEKRVFNSFIEDLRKLKHEEFVNNVEFCKELAAQFHQLPDGHFNIWFPGHVCYVQSQKLANVGKNDALSKSGDATYSFRSLTNASIAVLAIARFPDSENDAWNGFKASIYQAKKYENIIIDLRGNGGGDSTRGLELARELLNSSIMHNRKRIIRKNTAEAWTIYRNNILRNKISVESGNKGISHLDSTLREVDEKISVNNVFSKRQLITTFDPPKLDPMGYKGKIYVLIDGQCGSSCEHTLEALKFHPNVKSVGKNTFGAVHYGQMGLIRLPRSGVYLNLATQYFDLFQAGDFEKIGYQPDLVVPDGVDALGFVLGILKTKKKI